MCDITNKINEMIEECTTEVYWTHALGFVVTAYKGFAERKINDKNVSVLLVENCRNSKAKDKPRMMWKIEGKRVKAAELMQKISE